MLALPFRLSGVSVHHFCALCLPIVVGRYTKGPNVGGRPSAAKYLSSLIVLTFGGILPLLVSGDAKGQQASNPPRIGYIWPAGGQQGSTFEATIGGQFLEGVNEILTNHPGIQVTVSDYTRPLSQREINQLMQKLQAIREKVQSMLAGQDPRRRLGYQELFRKVAEEMGVTMEEVRALEEYRKQRMDPKRQPNPQIAERLFVEVSLAADVPPGQYYLRVKNRNGLSNPIVFQVGNWPEINEREPNDLVANQVPGPLPLVLNGQILPGDVDRFVLPLQKGQKIVFALAGRALIPYLADAVPGWFQAVLSLQDPTGKEVAFADDWRFHPDPVLLYEVPEDGQYTITVADAIYRGREDFVYRLLIGEVPFVTSIFPLGGQVGTKVPVQLTGWNLPETQIVVDLTQAAPSTQILQLFHSGGLWNHLPFAADTFPSIPESEPNDSVASANWLRQEVIVDGRIGSAQDVDVFCVDAKAGEEWVVEVTARRLGSPLDSVVRVTDAKGTTLGTNDDFDDKSVGLITHQADSYLKIRASQDGPLYIHLADIQQHGGPEYAYRLRISRPHPDFTLRLAPSTVNIAGGSHMPIDVWVVRRDGLEEDIFLQLVGQPEGFRLSGNWIPAGQDRCTMTLSVGGGINPDTYSLKLVGRATHRGETIEREVTPCDDLMQAFFYRHLVPADRWLVHVGRARQFAAPAWGFSATNPVKIPAGGKGEVRFPVPRGSMLAELKLQLREAPEGISLGELRQTAFGVALEILADKEKVQPGQKGNLIVELLATRPTRPGMPARTAPVGVLPAIPFEIVAP
jgi:hypothetical protein